jgi:hypothetical protein
MDNLPNLKETYENLSYFDNFGSSLIFFILISIILFLLISLSYAYLQASSLKADWERNRCKPSVLPFAGLVMQPTDMSMSEYTALNFSYCMQDNLKAVAGQSLEPLSFIVSSLSTMAEEASQSLNAVRAMTDKVRSGIADIFLQIYGKLVNIMIPLQELIIKVKDSFGKLQGVLVTSLYAFLGSYFGLKSLLGVIAQAIVNILIGLAASIMIMWLTPITWAPAAAATALFTAISIPLIIMIAFLKNTLQVNIKGGNLKVPKPKKLKCFDKNTLLEMNDGSFQKIVDLKPGDILRENNKVNAVFQVLTDGSQMYRLPGNIIVSDSHLVFDPFSQQWLRAKYFRESTPVDNYNEQHLYCLSTESGYIKIKSILFSDWDEMSEKERKQISLQFKKSNEEPNWFHKHFQNGLHPETLVILKNGEKKEIRNVKPGDKLDDGTSIYGTVKIDGRDVEQFSFSHGKVKGSSNLVYNKDPTHLLLTKTVYLENKREVIKKEPILYNILTESGTFASTNDIRFGDYNVAIDFL